MGEEFFDFGDDAFLLFGWRQWHHRFFYNLLINIWLLLWPCSFAFGPALIVPTTGQRNCLPTELSALPKDYQQQGNQIIYKAARLCGVDAIEIKWKPGRIVVEVSGDAVAYVSAPLEDYVDRDIEEIDLEDEAPPPNAIDVTALARAINSALDDEDGIGARIAETHEIEVTTPGSSDELQGDVMFQAYKGFDVIAQHRDPKTDKIKAIEGRLIERNDEFTIINIKGRMKKLKNSNVVSVKLPKAKKEKGRSR